MGSRKTTAPKKRRKAKPRTSDAAATSTPPRSTVPSSRPKEPAPLYSEGGDAPTENTDGVGRSDGGLH
jgi:hypothetical protein